MIASSLSDFLADASPALHLGAAFIAPLLPDCRVASPPPTPTPCFLECLFAWYRPVSLATATKDSEPWTGGGSGGGERGGAGGGSRERWRGKRCCGARDSETAKQMAARGGGVQAERGGTPSVGGTREPINSRSSCGARKQV